VWLNLLDERAAARSSSLPPLAEKNLKLLGVRIYGIECPLDLESHDSAEICGLRGPAGSPHVALQPATIHLRRRGPARTFPV